MGTTKEGTNSSKELAMVKTQLLLIKHRLIKSRVTKLRFINPRFLKNEFTNFMKANDAILKNMQTNMTSLTNSNLELKNMFGQFMKMNTTSSLGSETLPCNTITNPKEDLKGITTRSGNAYQGPTIPTTSPSLPKVVERKTEVTKDTVPPTNNGSTKDVQHPFVQTETPIQNSEPVVAPIIEPVVAPIIEPVVAPISAPKPNQKPSIPFTDSLILMPKFVPTIKNLLTNKDKLSELARTSLNEHCLVVLLKKLLEKLGDPGKFLIPCDFPRMDECLALADLDASINLMSLSVWNKLSLPELSPMCMTLELSDRSISRSVGVVEDVFVKTIRDLIDVFERELTLRIGKEAITFNLDQTSRYSANYNGNYLPQVRKELKICEAKTDKSSIDEPPEVELKDLPPHLEYAFLEGDDKLPVIIVKDLSDEEKTALITILKSHKRAITWKLSDIKGINPKFVRIKLSWMKTSNQRPWVILVYCVPKKGGFTVVENEENELIPTRLVMGWRVCIDYKMLKRCEDTNLCINWEKSHFMVKEGIVLGHKISKNGIEVDKSKVKVIAKLPHPTIVKGGFTVVENEEKELIPTRLVTGWGVCIDYRVVLGQHQEKHFRPIHYASKTITKAESNYTITEKEMLAVVFAFKKFRSYLIMNKSIVYTDHSTLKYLFAKKDSKARLLRWVLLHQEFKFKVMDTKGAENKAADHLSRLENPHQNVLNPKEINEAFPLETLNMVSFRALLLGRPLLVQNLCGSSHQEVCSQLEAVDILKACHNGPTGGHHGPNYTAKKVWNPRAIISDSETHFCKDKYAKVMLKYGVTHRLATAYHAQTSGHVEVSNHGLKKNHGKDSGREPCLLVGQAR
nr:reverse transcriptase domain-containing protein [Tanacetum cinerariifolium]